MAWVVPAKCLWLARSITLVTSTWQQSNFTLALKTITPNTSGPDFAYLRDGAHRDFLYAPALRHFGLSEADIMERALWYEQAQRQRNARQAAKLAALDISDAKVETPATSQPSVHVVRNQASRLVCKSRNNYSDRPLVFVAPHWSLKVVRVARGPKSRSRPAR